MGPLILSKYERVQLIAARVEQLLGGAPPTVDDPCDNDTVRVAELEVDRRTIPIRVARHLPNGKVQVLSLDQFIPDATR